MIPVNTFLHVFSSLRLICTTFISNVITELPGTPIKLSPLFCAGVDFKKATQCSWVLEKGDRLHVMEDARDYLESHRMGRLVEDYEARLVFSLIVSTPLYCGHSLKFTLWCLCLLPTQSAVMYPFIIYLCKYLKQIPADLWKRSL